MAVLSKETKPAEPDDLVYGTTLCSDAFLHTFTEGAELRNQHGAIMYENLQREDLENRPEILEEGGCLIPAGTKILFNRQSKFSGLHFESGERILLSMDDYENSSSTVSGSVIGTLLRLVVSWLIKKIKEACSGKKIKETYIKCKTVSLPFSFGVLASFSLRV